MLNKYLIKGGVILSVIDGTETHADIKVENGIITKIAPNIEPCIGIEVINAEGCYITTGWVDPHTHVGSVHTEGIGDGIGLNPYDQLLPNGITYAIDPGTSGPFNYEEYRRQVMYRTDLRYKTYLDMALYGINLKRMDTSGPSDVDEDKVREVFKKYRDEFLGLKVRIDPNYCWDPMYMLSRTRALADELGTYILVHAPRLEENIEDVLSYLKAGDVLTHIYSGKSPKMRLTDDNGKLKACVRDAQQRGVIFDIGHGTNVFCYKVAEDAFKEGFIPDTFSTDLWPLTYHGLAYNMATILTKMRGVMGLPWYQLIQKCTVAPVKLNRIPDKDVTVEEGKIADFVVFSIDKGKFLYTDSEKDDRIVNERIHLRYTCLKDKIYLNMRTDDVTEVE